MGRINFNQHQVDFGKSEKLIDIKISESNSFFSRSWKILIQQNRFFSVYRMEILNGVFDSPESTYLAAS